MSKHEEADVALRANQAQFASIIHHAPMMVSFKDKEGRYTFVNAAFEKFTGRSASVMLGKTVANFNPPEFADMVTAEDRAALENKRPVQREFTTPNANGARTALLAKTPGY